MPETKDSGEQDVAADSSFQSVPQSSGVAYYPDVPESSSVAHYPDVKDRKTMSP